MNKIIKQSDKDYFASEGLSNSYLKLWDRSPAHAEIGLSPTPAMNDGSISHKYILEKDSFFIHYDFLPEEIKSKTSKAYKELNAKTSKELLKYDYKNILESISNNIRNYKLIDNLTLGHILDNSEKEISIYWEDEVEGKKIQKKGKIDIAYNSDDYNIIFDLKKTTDCLDFGYAVRKYKYYRQASWYIEGYQKLTEKKTIFIFIPFEFSEPFGVKTFELSEDYLLKGDSENLFSTINYIKWKEEGSKKIIYKEGIETLEKPAYL
jgi:hypothetical protein